MPCRDYRDDEPCDHDALRRDYEREFEHNSTVAEMLCNVMRAAEKKEVEHVIFANMPDQELRLILVDWWHKHKLRDDKRIAAEKEALRKRAVRESALSKLTAEERKELGLPHK